MSHHASDSVIGHNVNGVQCYDSFDLYAYFENKEKSPKFSKSLIAAGNMLMTPEGISINKHNQRIEMKAREQEAEKILNHDDEMPPAANQERIKIEWGAPLTIKQQLLPVLELPADTIPAPFKAWVEDISYRMSVPLDFPFISTIIVAGSIIGTGVMVKPKLKDDWSIIPNLWGGIVGDPSVMKTPVLEEIINKSITRLEIKSSEQFKTDIMNYQNDKFVYDEKIKDKQQEIKDSISFKKKKESPKTLGALKSELLELQKDSVPAPTERRYKVNDCSIEALIQVNKDNARGLLYFRDELIGLFKRWDKQGNESDRALMLETWTGKGVFTQDRIGRGSIRAENLCVSLIGSIQPDKLTGYLKEAMAGGNDGFVQRLQMMVYPDKKVFKFVDDYPDTIAKNRFYQIIEKLAGWEQIDFIRAGAILNEDDKTPSFRFDNEGYELFTAWLKRLMDKAENPEEHALIQEHLSKYKSLMPSIALIYHLVEVADNTSRGGAIPAHCVSQAIGVVDYLESHARRIYALAIKTNNVVATALSEKILQKSIESPFSVRDVYRNGWKHLDTPESAQKAIDHLVAHDWIQETQTETKKTGRKHGQLYIINPKILDMENNTTLNHQ